MPVSLYVCQCMFASISVSASVSDYVCVSVSDPVSVSGADSESDPVSASASDPLSVSLCDFVSDPVLVNCF